MKDIWKKQKILFIVLAYLVLLPLIFTFGVRPLLEGVNKKRIGIEEQKINYEIRKTQISNLPTIQSQLEEIKKDEDALNILIKKSDVLSLIERLEFIAEQTGNEIDISIPEKDTFQEKKSNKESKDRENLVDSRPNNDYLAVDIKITGTFQNIYNFIYKVENMGYFSDIVSFEILKSILKEEVKSGGLLEKNNPDKLEENIEMGDNLLSANLKIFFYLEEEK